MSLQVNSFPQSADLAIGLIFHVFGGVKLVDQPARHSGVVDEV
jgi:hypothetical protein